MQEKLKKIELKKIGIQGVKGAFHHLAALEFFKKDNKNIEIIECGSFKDLAYQLNDNKIDAAIMAIENTIAGSILPNYALLEKYQFKIIGECYLRVELNLLAIEGQTIQDIEFILSHPMAILQSDEFLSLYPHLKVIEVNNTAEAAKMIKDKHLLNYAAIASGKAAEMYGLSVLAKDIETNKKNFTRFLILVSKNTYEKMRMQENSPINLTNKASIHFQLAHKVGSLFHVLSFFNDCNINLTKIQSLPVIGKPSEYAFIVDLEWQKYEDYEKAMTNIAPYVTHLIHLGEYTKANKIF